VDEISQLGALQNLIPDLPQIYPMGLSHRSRPVEVADAHRKSANRTVLCQGAVLLAQALVYVSAFLVRSSENKIFPAHDQSQLRYRHDLPPPERHGQQKADATPPEGRLIGDAEASHGYHSEPMIEDDRLPIQEFAGGEQADLLGSETAEERSLRSCVVEKHT
jgi:hypothetical protein